MRALSRRPFVAQAGCRVVVLSSTAHTFGSVEVNDLHYKKGRSYSPWGAYGQSKACNLLFAKVGVGLRAGDW